MAAYADAHQTTHTLSNLVSGQEYKYRIRAENPDGVGPPRPLAERVVPRPQLRKFRYSYDLSLSLLTGTTILSGSNQILVMAPTLCC